MKAAAQLCLWVVPVVAVVSCLVGVGLRLTSRDGCPILAPVFYATPLPLVAGVAACATALAWRRRRRTVAAIGALVALGCASWFVATSRFAVDVAQSQRGALRVALWNVARGTFGWSQLAEHLAGFDADVVCLVESRGLQLRDAELRQCLPGYTIAYADGGFTILSRVGLHDVQSFELPRGVALRAAVGTSRRLDLVLVDVRSNPFGARGPSIATLRDSLPDLLLGDFNTPRTSVHFDAFRADYTHAFEQGGVGFVETWPWPVPALDLDHVWVRAPLRVKACRYERHWCSDHCAVIVDLASL